MRKLFWSLLAFILVILAGITLLITTNSGLRLALQAVNRYTPVQIKTTNLTGVVLGTIAAKTITVNTTGINLKVTDFSLRYNIFAMLWNTIEVDHIKIGSATGALIETALADEAEESSSSYSPKVVIKYASVDLIDIKSANKARPIHAKDLYWQGIISKDRVDILLRTGIVSRFLKSSHVKIWGPINNYQITASIVSKYTQLGATGSGTSHSANFVLFSESKDKTVISGNLSLDWYKGFQWDGNVQLKNISTKPFVKNGPAIQLLTATSAGHAGESLDAISWQLDAKTAVGDIQTQGEYTKTKLILDWKISNLNPHAFYPKANGLINTTGAWNNGKTAGSLSVQKAQWKKTSLKSLALNWEGDLKQQLINTLKLKLNQLNSESINIRKGDIDFQQTQNKTTPFTIDLKTAAGGTPIRSLGITGSIKQEPRGYTLNLNQFNLHALLRKWSLRNKTTLSLTTEKKEDSTITTWKQTPFCLESKSAYLCQNSSNHNGDWTATLSAKNIPLQNISEMTNITLPTNLEANIHQKSGEPILGQLQVHIPKAVVTFAEYAVEHPVQLKDTQLIVKLLPKTIAITSTSNWGKRDYWNFSGDISRADSADSSWGKSQIKSSLKLSINDLGFINTLSDALDIHSGSVNANLSVSGTVNSPKTNGTIQIKDMNFEIVPVENMIRNINGQIKLNNLSAKMNLTGQTKTAPIHIAADASIDPEFKNLQAKFSVQGNNVQVANSRNYQAVADIALKGSIANKALSLKGKVTIPTATISPASIATSATTLPRDVVIAGDKKEKGMGSNVDILISLGKKVVVKTKQLYARLIGDLHILQKDDSGPLGKGTIHIKDGKVSDFDLNLQIADDSSISYDNTSLTEPFINVKVFRTLKQGGFGTSALSADTDLTVGISAVGVYQNLVVTLYSSPVQLGQSDILSYLILGHPVGNAGAFNLASLLATVGSLSSDSLSNGLNKLLSIKKTLGFTELGVQSNLSLDALGTPYGVDESGFVIGRYLTSKIYVRYVSGISSDLNLFQLQYFFNPNWSIQLQSGNVNSTNVQGIDGLYHFTHW
jgi:autotransporter translocation and assembly factor TamB